MNITHLRKNGWKININHFRNVNLNCKKDKQMVFQSNFDIRQNLSYEDKCKLNKGGKTIVQVQPPASQTIFEGTAICSFKDNFNYKIGFEIALGRALKLAGI